MSDLNHDNNSEGSQDESSQQSESNSRTDMKFSDDEKDLIARMYNLLGERWSLIAGRIPGRSAEEIEKYWTTKCSRSQS
ncbi:MYB-like transcription factor ETC1 [Amborella trichopoda]|uniref:Uncharacterized protein n=1 Tax=Amborella trichopoda TaxID=13333 RepID=W1PBH2_AMBTC|nr:MYB-like transcription factor ETC1 [Amborella trichopoda]ERN04380.1 hypothetical protein AMTR_s00147p00088570 [Amborella trichopoda]|eukprot:XP_006842705.1 MYB-like transcription factor ETC1 [Amborella trichopoda]